MLSKDTLLYSLLAQMRKRGASDLLINANFPPSMKLDGELVLVSEEPLSPSEAHQIVNSSFNEKVRKEFEETKEANFSIMFDDIGRYRVSSFIQQGYAGMVIRATNSTVPSFEELQLPNILANVSMSKRGIVLVTGATGSGKSTTMASMIDYRNRNSHGHIISIEDPIEFMHSSKKCMVTQREVGMDTQSWHIALKNTLRQAPDVIVLGEIRDRDTMEYAIQYAETGHLCMGTLHANNSNQAIDRILSFFPKDQQRQVLVDVSLNLRSIICQRLIKKPKGGRAPAIEVMLGTPLIADLIMKGEVHALKEAMRHSKEQGMICFDDALFQLYEQDMISYEQALINADSENDVRLNIKLNSKKILNDNAMDNQDKNWQLV